MVTTRPCQKLLGNHHSVGLPGGGQEKPNLQFVALENQVLHSQPHGGVGHIKIIGQLSGAPCGVMGDSGLQTGKEITITQFVGTEGVDLLGSCSRGHQTSFWPGSQCCRGSPELNPAWRKVNNSCLWLFSMDMKRIHKYNTKQHLSILD